VHGEHSPIMDAESARRVAGAIPSGQPLTLAGAHHHLIVEDPESFARAVLQWAGAEVFRVQS
jgi:pimeloyl-ACP methyl ester carboxylesterase